MARRESQNWKSEGPRHWLVTAWQEAFRRVLKTMAEAASVPGQPQIRLNASAGAPETWDRWVSPLWQQFTLDAVAKGALQAGAGKGVVEAVAGLVSGGAKLGDNEARDTYLEMLNQATSATADAIAGRMGKRVSFAAGQTCGSPVPADYAVHIELELEGSTHVLALVPNVELMEAIDPGRTDAAEPASSVPAAPVLPRNLDLLMEVELPVSVNFGRTQLPLRDVLKLSSGSIVELNRLANEPVDILIDDCVIARGEVVVVEGNYGIRVTEVVSRQERIRSLL